MSALPAAARETKVKPELGRREQAVSGAIDVLAQLGARGLTHRQVDRHLNWPLGSTSNYFRRRNDLFIAIAECIVQLDLADVAVFEADLAQSDELTIELFADSVVKLFQSWMQPTLRSRTVAGAEILFESTRNPEVDAAARSQIDLAQASFRRIFEQLGSPDPIRSTEFFSVLIVSMYVGLSIAKTVPTEEQLRALVLSWAATSIAQARASDGGEGREVATAHSVRQPT